MAGPGALGAWASRGGGARGSGVEEEEGEGRREEKERKEKKRENGKEKGKRKNKKKKGKREREERSCARQRNPRRRPRMVGHARVVGRHAARLTEREKEDGTSGVRDRERFPESMA